MGTRRLAPISSKQAARRLDVALGATGGDELGRLHGRDLFSDCRRNELIDARTLFLADLGYRRLQGRR